MTEGNEATEWCSLSELARVTTGGTPSKTDPKHFGGGIPWVKPSDLREEHPIMGTAETLSEKGVAKSRMVPAGSVLVCCIGSIGRIGIAGVPLTTNQQINAVSFGNRILPDYGYFCLARIGEQLRRQASTSVVAIINKNDFSKIRIPVRPLEEQHYIAGVLIRAAEIRRRADAARAKARAIVPALFLDTFGDPAANPKGWPVVKVGDLLESAAYGTSQKANERGDGIPMIRMGNVTSGGQLDTTDLKHIDIAGQEREKAELLQGDLLFNRTNSKELVGKTGLWDGRFEAVAASYFIRLRAKRDLCDPSYLWAFFNTRHMKRVLFDTARGAIGQANINAKELRAFRIAVPPYELQLGFAEQVQRIESLARHLDAAAEKAEAMAAALSAEVFGSANGAAESNGLCNLA